MPLSKSPEPREIAAAIRAAAGAEGFVACGIAPAIDSHGFNDLVKWIDAGFAAEMDYFANRLDAYRHPRGVLPGARSVVAMLYPYPALDPTPNGMNSIGIRSEPTALAAGTAQKGLDEKPAASAVGSQGDMSLDPTVVVQERSEPTALAAGTAQDGRDEEPAASAVGSQGDMSLDPTVVVQDGDYRTHGRIARYTWMGSDYHDIIHPKLKRICSEVRELCPDAHARGIVDTAPLMEREVAQLAGLGWRGKNTLLLNRTLGSYFFLACVLVDIELPADAPFEADHCGTCRACLDACPTDAFVGPHVLDASKCISYLTIENRGMIPEPLREGIGDWVFGCDVCQEVCPWTRKPAQRAAEIANQDSDAPLSGHSRRGQVELTSLFSLDDESFRERFRHTPMWRTRRRGMLRNAAIVLGNVGDMNCVVTLLGGLQDPEPVVRASCVWAIRKIVDRADSDDTSWIDERLQRVQREETDPVVLAEFVHGSGSC